MYGHSAMVEQHAAALKPDPERALREFWTAQGVPVEKHDALIRQIAGARVSFAPKPELPAKLAPGVKVFKPEHWSSYH